MERVKHYMSGMERVKHYMCGMERVKHYTSGMERVTHYMPRMERVKHYMLACIWRGLNITCLEVVVHIYIQWGAAVPGHPLTGLGSQF